MIRIFQIFHHMKRFFLSSPLSKTITKHTQNLSAVTIPKFKENGIDDGHAKEKNGIRERERKRNKTC